MSQFFNNGDGLPSSTFAAFGEILVAEPSPEIQLQFPYNINTDYVDTDITGTGSVTQVNSMALLQTGASATSSALMTSRNILHYQSGQGAAGLFTAIFTEGVAGSTQITGIGNEDDGFFFGYDETSFGILHRNNGVDTWIPQSSWNGDKYDGSGPSGRTIDPTLGNVFKVQFQWLGFGNISFFIENQATGIFDKVHTINYPNNNSVPSLSNPSLMLYSQVINDANTSNISLRNASMSAYVQGKILNIENRQSFAADKTVSTLQNLFTLRNNSTFQGVANRTALFVDGLSIYNSSGVGSDAQFYLILNPTVGGVPVFTDINTNTSVAAVDTAGTTVTGGRQLFRFYLGGGSSNFIDLDPFIIQLNPGDRLVVGGSNIGVGVRVVSASLSWRERF